jgi:hypothetical protein
MAAEKTLATFRIDPDKWEQFKLRTGEDNSNASSALLEFVDWYLQGNRLSRGEAVASSADIDKLVDERIDIKLQGLYERLAAMEGQKLGEAIA